MHLVDCFVDVFTFVRQLTAVDSEPMSDTAVRQRLDELLATKAHLATAKSLCFITHGAYSTSVAAVF